MLWPGWRKSRRSRPTPKADADTCRPAQLTACLSMVSAGQASARHAAAATIRVRRVANIGQNLSNLFFTAVAVTFIAVEGGPLMLAAWLKKAHLKEGEEKGIATGWAEGRAEGHAEGHAEGRAEGRALILEALRNMQPEETVADAIARLEKEREKSDNHKG